MQSVAEGSRTTPTIQRAPSSPNKRGLQCFFAGALLIYLTWAGEHFLLLVSNEMLALTAFKALFDSALALVASVLMVFGAFRFTRRLDASRPWARAARAFALALPFKWAVADFGGAFVQFLLWEEIRFVTPRAWGHLLFVGCIVAVGICCLRVVKKESERVDRVLLAAIVLFVVLRLGYVAAFSFVEYGVLVTALRWAVLLSMPVLFALIYWRTVPALEDDVALAAL